MPVRINLNTLAKFFRTGLGPMPAELREIWTLIQKIASTPQQKSILADFKSNPTARNQLRLAAVLSKPFTPVKGTIKLRFSAGRKAKANVFSYLKNKSLKGRHTAPLIGENKTGRFAGWRSPGGAAKKKAAPKKKPAAKRATPKKKGLVKGAVLKRAAKKGAPKKKAGSRIKGKKLPANRVPAKSLNQVKIFTRASLDKLLVLKKPSSVNVTISREPLQNVKGKQTKTTAAQVNKTKLLRVQIKPVLNCKAKGQHTYTIPVPEEESSDIQFLIVGTHAGEASFSVDVWQGFELAATLLFNVEVVMEKINNTTTEMQVTNNPTGNITKPMNQMRINQRQNGNKSEYEYEVYFAGINQWQTYDSPKLNKKTASYVSDLYKKIEQLYSDSGGDAKEFDAKLKRYGADLFLTLFPADLQQLLYDNRDKLKSIHIVSNEPDIPWEILVIRQPDTAKPTRASDPFFAELGIIRWLRRGAFPGERLQSRATRSKFVIPAYHHEKRILPMATEEAALLTGTFKASQVPATVKSVESLLRGGKFDLLHFCCHGEGETTNNISARLVMEEIREKGNWKPTYVDQLFVEQCGTFIRKGSPQPIIVLNGCRTGILGRKIAGYGGFAKAFINAGAGVFVGGLWNVEDSAAYAFVSAFYKSLKKGKTLSEATIEARNKSKAANNATWLAYVVYGNPFAKFV